MFGPSIALYCVIRIYFWKSNSSYEDPQNSNKQKLWPIGSASWKHQFLGFQSIKRTLKIISKTMPTFQEDFSIDDTE